ncbi:MAG TPA: enoyl-CoA hydratase family protein [Actinomycetota bacterium]|nr:enoyl-CoA hydratase family protein [Actinomycetota bacterium]
MTPFTGSPGAPEAWDHFRFEVADGVATITFDRPEKLNALTFEIYADLRDLLAWIPTRDDVRVLVITGEGRGFCSGGDVHEIIGELLRSDRDRLLEFTRMTGAVVQNMRACSLPVIASVNGIAAGAGSVIALAADFRVMARSASFAFLFTKVGLAGADMGSAYLLPRMIGLSRATELLMLGETIESGTAEALGLTYRVVQDSELPGVTNELARSLAEGPARAYAQTKLLLTRELEMSLGDALELEAQTQAELMTSEDHAEFYRAFNEGRKPNWTGR